MALQRSIVAAEEVKMCVRSIMIIVVDSSGGRIIIDSGSSAVEGVRAEPTNKRRHGGGIEGGVSDGAGGRTIVVGVNCALLLQLLVETRYWRGSKSPSSAHAHPSSPSSSAAHV